MTENRIGCHNCVGACCREKTAMYLNDEEAETLRRGGTQLIDLTGTIFSNTIDALIASLHQRRTGTGQVDGTLVERVETESYDTVYGLETDYGYLITDGDWPKRGLFGKPERPRACNNFEEGGRKCQGFRNERIPKYQIDVQIS